jgi:preprotein translocase subunit SecG
MEIWMTLILTVHVLVALAIIFLVLLQHGKGADMGAAFGGGSSGSLFGATGSANFLSRTTAALAVVFFITSLGLGYIATHKPKTGGSVMQDVSSPPAATVAPVTDVPKPTEAPSGSKANEVPK